LIVGFKTISKLITIDIFNNKDFGQEDTECEVRQAGVEF